MGQSPFINRWRIMALLIEQLQLKQYIQVTDLLVYGSRYVEAEAVLDEAGMEMVTNQTYMPGERTYDWITFHLGFHAGGFPWRPIIMRR